VGAPGSPSEPLGGPAIDVSNIGGGRSRVSVSAPYGAHHRRLLHRWWALLGLRQRIPWGALPLQLPSEKFKVIRRGAENWPHLWARNLPRGELRGHCRYPADWVPPHTSFKSRQGTGCASTRCHIPCSSGPHLPTEVGCGTATCPAAPDLASVPRWAPALQCVSWSQTSPPC
jgi:hypothetical protein